MSDKKNDPPEGFISQDRQKMGSFYNFSMDDSKIQQIQKRSRRMLLRFAVTGIVFGFFTEWLLGNGKIYDNIIKKTTMRRLNAKKKQDDRIGERLRYKQAQLNSKKVL